MQSTANFKKYLAFGTGIGIEIGDKDLGVTMVRVRPSEVRLLGAATLSNFRERPAAEWGAECSRFQKEHGGAHLTATVLLPRREVIVRLLALPGVAAKDVAAAIAFQVDSLHPYGDEDVVYGWSRLEAGSVLIGILRRATLDYYLSLFSEAGIAVASFTFSASALYAAHRLPSSAARADGEFVAVGATPTGTLEVYGESAARPVFSAEFDLPTERATALAAAELRLDAETQARMPVTLDQILPAPENRSELSCSAMPYATALAGACPWLAPAANLLPAERRSVNSRAVFVPTLVLAALLLLAGGALLAHSALQDKRYLGTLEAEIAKLEPQAKRAAALDRQIDRSQSRVRLLDEFRGHSKADLDALNELTRILAPPTWTNAIDITRDAVTISGETEQAAPLLKIIDASPLFQNSEFAGSLGRVANNEQFRIRAAREGQR